MSRTLVVTIDFPPRAGGIQAFVHGVLLHQPPDSVVVYAPAWKRAGQFDAEQPFPVIRHRTSLMLPEPMVLNKARDIAAEYECDRLLFGAAAPLGLLAPRLRSRGMGPIVAITHGHEAAWASTPGARSVMRSIVADSVEVPPSSGRSGFGRWSRDSGHSRVPAPPHMITGMIIARSLDPGFRAERHHKRRRCSIAACRAVDKAPQARAADVFAAAPRRSGYGPTQRLCYPPLAHFAEQPRTARSNACPSSATRPVPA